MTSAGGASALLGHDGWMDRGGSASPPSDWIFLFLFRLLPGCSPQVRLPDLSDHLAGFLQCLQREGERRGDRLPSGTRRRQYLQHIVCFV